MVSSSGTAPRCRAACVPRWPESRSAPHRDSGQRGALAERWRECRGRCQMPLLREVAMRRPSPGGGGFDDSRAAKVEREGARVERRH